MSSIAEYYPKSLVLLSFAKKPAFIATKKVKCQNYGSYLKNNINVDLKYCFLFFASLCDAFFDTDIPQYPSQLVPFKIERIQKLTYIHDI